jgi:hypothetical protein
MKRSRVSACCALGLGAVLFASPASAQEEEEATAEAENIAVPAAAPPRPARGLAKTPPPPTESYAWHILAADAASLGTGIAFAVTVPGEDDDAMKRAKTTVAVGGFGAYFVASPIVHAAHGRLAVGAGSLALRVLGVPASAMTGALVIGMICPDGKSRDWGCLSSAVLGFGVGLVGGVVAVTSIDAGLLAREPANKDERKDHVEEPSKTKSAKAQIRLFPRLDPVSKSASLGLGGTF